jgi:glycine oxidase
MTAERAGTPPGLAIRAAPIDLTSVTSQDVIVVGAGVLGLACAAELAAQGLSVTVVDPGGPNASAIAAGMIAPAMESLTEDLPPRTVALLKAARALWPDFAARHGLTLMEDGAEWRGPGAEAALTRLKALGFAAELRPGGVFTPDDARIDPEAALSALAAPAGRHLSRATAVGRDHGRWTVATDTAVLTADHLVLATGTAEALTGLPPAVAALVRAITPIRGQIAGLAEWVPAHVLRTSYGYAVPDARGGVRIGSGMEAGRRDLTPDLAAARVQVAAVCAALGLTPSAPRVRVGVRGAVVDGLPLAGPLDGLQLALAPRRNGWLLAPLVARVLTDAVLGRPPGMWAADLDPIRFSPAAG